MIQFINRVKDTWFFPNRMDGYSLFFHKGEYGLTKGVNDLVKENKLPESHPLAYLNVIALYLIFALPFAFLLGYVSGSVEKAVIALFILLGIGFLLGSIHASLGALGIMFGVFVFAQNTSIVVATIPSIKYWWTGLPMLLLFFAIYTQIASSPISKPKNNFLRFLFGSAITIAGFLIIRSTSLQLTSWNYYYSFLLLSYALSAPIIQRVEKEGNINFARRSSAGTWISATLSLGTATIIVWGWAASMFANMALWMKLFGFAAALFVGVIVYLTILISPFEQESNNRPVFFAEKRWMWLLFYLSFQFAVPPTTALIASTIGVLAYSLSFANLNLNQNDIKHHEFAATTTISALIWFYIVAGFFMNTDWLRFAQAFFINPMYSTPLPLIAFLAPAIALTITGRHKSDLGWVLLGIFLVFLVSSIWPGGSFPFSFIQSGLTLTGLFLGIVVGYTRIFVWPLLSLVIARELKGIRSSLEIPKERMTLAANLLDIYCWPTPLKRVDLTAELMKRGLVETYLSNKYLKEDLTRAKQKLANEFFSSDFTIIELTKSNVSGSPKIIQDSVFLLQKAKDQNISQLEKVEKYLEVLNNLHSHLNGKQKATTPSPRLANHERDMVNKLAKVVTDDLLLNYDQQQVFEKKLQEIVNNIPKAARKFDDSQLEKKEQKFLDEQFAYYAQLATQLSSSLRSLEDYLDMFSAETKIVYFAILGIAPNLANLRASRFDIPSQRRIVQTTIQNIAEIENSIKKKSLVFDESSRAVISVANPWFTMIDYLSRLTTHLVNLLDAQERRAKDKVVEAITSSDTIEKLPSIAKQLEALNSFGEKYGSPLDEIIKKLEDITQDADSAMAMKGYSQRLGVQDVLDAINNLRGMLSTRFLHESADIIAPLDNLASSIYESIHAASEKQVGGFRSPYMAGKPIPEIRSDLFKGRLDLAEKIVYKLLSQTVPTFILYGPRRMGKTSFLLQLPRLMRSEFIPAYFDAQSGNAQTDWQFLYSLASSLYKQIKKSLDNAQAPDRKIFEQQPFIAFDEWLDGLQPHLSGKTIFFTIDEFEAIGNAISAGTLTEDVLGHIRHVMQHNPNIVLLFAGVHTIDALGPNAASYFISAYPLEISYLTEKDAEELIVNPDPSAGELPKYDNAVIAEIIRLTKCQPYLLQAVCNEVLGVANEISLSQITMPALNEAVSRALSTSLYFKNVWEESQKDGQNILRSIIKKPVTSFTGKKKLIAEDMLKKRVIRIADDGSYAIEIPLVEMWLRNQFS